MTRLRRFRTFPPQTDELRDCDRRCLPRPLTICRKDLTAPSCASYTAPRFAGRLRYTGAVQVETVENSTKIIFGRKVNFI
jgi:hypothetical protein